MTMLCYPKPFHERFPRTGAPFSGLRYWLWRGAAGTVIAEALNLSSEKHNRLVCTISGVSLLRRLDRKVQKALCTGANPNITAACQLRRQ